MTPLRRIQAAIAIASVCAVVFLARTQIPEHYHRHRLNREIETWRNPMMVGTPDEHDAPNLSDYSGVADQLAALVSIDAIAKLDLKMRLYDSATLRPSAALGDLQNSEDPAMLFHHVKGDPRSQPQDVIIWCNHGDVQGWTDIARRSLSSSDQNGG